MSMSPNLRRRDHEGAAAVELALVLPLLILLVGGIIDFGFAFNSQISLTHAAREGVRVEAVTGDTDGAEATAEAAFQAPAASAPGAQVTQPCSTSDEARMIVTANTQIFLLQLLPFVDNEIPLEGEAVMRCGG